MDPISIHFKPLDCVLDETMSESQLFIFLNSTLPIDTQALSLLNPGQIYTTKPNIFDLIQQINMTDTLKKSARVTNLASMEVLF